MKLAQYMMTKVKKQKKLKKKVKKHGLNMKTDLSHLVQDTTGVLADIFEEDFKNNDYC